MRSTPGQVWKTTGCRNLLHIIHIRHIYEVRSSCVNFRTLIDTRSSSVTQSAPSASVSEIFTPPDPFPTSGTPSSTGGSSASSNSSSMKTDTTSTTSSSQLSTISLASGSSSATLSFQTSATPPLTPTPTATADTNCATCRSELGKCFEDCDPSDDVCLEICSCFRQQLDENCKLCTEITTCSPKPTSTAASTPKPTPLTPEEVEAACDRCVGAVAVCINGCGTSRNICSKDCKCNESKNNPDCYNGGGCGYGCDD